MIAPRSWLGISNHDWLLNSDTPQPRACGDTAGNGQPEVQTDAHDLVAIVDLLLASRGIPVMLGNDALVRLTAWAEQTQERSLRS
jgi:hypothetical protein